MVSISSTTDLDYLGHVLSMLWDRHFICPLDVAGLGLRYLTMSFLVKLGHPLRKPLLVAFYSLSAMDGRDRPLLN
jgi:hypothetical protein